MKAAFTLFVSGLVLAGVAPADAQDVGQHPAVFAPRQLPGVDPSAFIVGHPASPTWHAVHTNADHPAVQVALRHQADGVDPNTFVVQPPASTRWTLGPGQDGLVAAATPAPTNVR